MEMVCDGDFVDGLGEGWSRGHGLAADDWPSLCFDPIFAGFDEIADGDGVWDLCGDNELKFYFIVLHEFMLLLAHYLNNIS